jgi:uncharacterized double-CXXCG motif protein
MNRAYLIKRDTVWERAHAPELDAVHRAALPGVSCPSCGSWAASGIQYPSIDVAAIEREQGRLEPWPVSLAEFAALKSRVRHFFGPEQEILPGAKLGPIKGKGRGQFGDFAWLNPWTVLVRETVARKLEYAHFRIVGVKCDLDFHVGDEEPLFEIEALPVVRLMQSLVPRRCEICGRLPIKVPDRIVLNSHTYDNMRPIQRIYELPTYIIVSSEFANFIATSLFTNIVLEPVAVDE